MLRKPASVLLVEFELRPVEVDAPVLASAPPSAVLGFVASCWVVSLPVGAEPVSTGELGQDNAIKADSVCAGLELEPAAIIGLVRMGQWVWSYFIRQSQRGSAALSRCICEKSKVPQAVPPWSFDVLHTKSH